MTKLLASVVDDRELELAIDAGVDIIDLKNPRTGALGALPLAQIESLVARTDGRCPVSATVGDLPAEPLQLTSAIRQTAACGVDYVKVGFFSKRKLTECLRAIADLGADYSIVAVLFADLDPPLWRLAEFANAGFRGIMLDTAGKGGGGLLQQIDLRQIEDFVGEARALGMLNGLAGSLQRTAIPKLLPLAPDYLGFRGALCERGERISRIAPHRLLEVRDTLTLSLQQIDQVVAGG
ncbi:MAG: (5-formylfuran-3-yl)methyl phosphate synthase [Candidatus Thiodiazotropha sp.]